MIKKMPAIVDTKAKANSPLAAKLDRLIRAFEPVRVNGALLSEDFSFCHRWNQCGGQVWVNTNHTIEHIGLHRFRGSYSDLVPGIAESPAQIRAKEAVAKPKIVQRVRVHNAAKPK
ncbi:MAG: hypothetical protein DI543_26165 [Bradyrhizobium icense]|nr:MAG: hypothetical protein DI543_26165 [Bradyrhizobium icense]